MGPEAEDQRSTGGGTPLRQPRVKLLLGLGLLFVVVWVAWRTLDVRAVAATAGRADPALLGLGAVSSMVGLACWSESMRLLLPPGTRRVSRRRGFQVYATGALVRNAIPLGYASSIAVLAYVFRREGATTLDRSLAAVSVAEFLNMVASTGVAVTGVLLLVAVGPSSPLVGWLALGGVVVAVGGSTAAVLLWYRRGAVERVANATASALSRVVDRLADRPSGALSPEAVEAAIAGYYRSLATVSDRRRVVGVSFGYALLAWLGLVGSLYVCGMAIGYRVPLPVAMVVVPIAGYATALPVPGGLGGYELGLVGALVALGGAEVVVAVAVTLLFRLCSYWLFIGLGGVAAATLSVDLRELAAAATDGGPSR